jgi:hypothetical protein
MSELFIVVEGEKKRPGEREYQAITEFAHYGQDAKFKVRFGRWDGDNYWIFTNINDKKEIRVTSWKTSGNLDRTKEYLMKYKREVISDDGARYGLPTATQVLLRFTPIKTYNQRTAFMAANQRLDNERLNGTLPEHVPPANRRELDGQMLNEMVPSRDLHREIGSFLGPYGGKTKKNKKKNRRNRRTRKHK